MMFLYFSVHDYMRLFGQVAEPNPSELLRHSVHQMHLMSSMESHFNEHDHDQEFIHGHTLRILNVYVSLFHWWTAAYQAMSSTCPSTFTGHTSKSERVVECLLIIDF